MSAMLGKRKRRVVEVPVSKIRKTEDSSSEESEVGGLNELDAQEIFRRHFEAQFEALPEVPKPEVTAKDSDDDDEEEEEEEDGEDWGGLSDENTDGVVVVQHTKTGSSTAGMSREELKAFMVWQLFKCTRLFSDRFVEPQASKFSPQATFNTG